MAAVALAGYVALLVVAFGVRTILHRRRTGATGWVRPPTFAAWVGDGLFTLGVVAIIAGIVLDLVGALHPVNAVDSVAVQAVGVVLLAGGAGVTFTAQAQMRSAWRAGIDLSARNELISEGLFGRVRNPFYLGMLTASLGATLIVPNIASVVAWPVLLIGCEIDVRLVEERHLRAAHGDEYAAYERSVPRFVPTQRPRRPRRP